MPNPVRDRRILYRQQGTTYYVDATGGSDTNPGTLAAPWQTVAKVNSARLNPGDSVLFKRGQNWTGGITGVSGVTYGAYGNGALPVINGNDTVDCFSANGKSRITLNSLDLYFGAGSGANFTNCTDIIINNVICRSAGNDNLIFFSGCRRCTVTGGEFHDSRNVLGSTQSSGIEIADGCDSITVDGAKCYNNVHVGVTVHNHDYGGGNTTQLPTNITIKNVEAYGNGQYGFLFLNQSPAVGQNIGSVVYNGCYAHDNLHGIYIVKSSSVTLYPTGATFLNCRSTGNTQYAAYVQGDNITFARCLFTEGRMMRLTSFRNVSLLNCTLYITTWAAYGCIQVYDLDTRTNGLLTVKNCIFASPDTGEYMWDAQASTLNSPVLDYNLYQGTSTLNRWKFNSTLSTFANWKTNSGGDTHSSAGANPLFTNTAGGDFTLQAGSPAIGTGIDVGYGTNIGAF